MNGLVRRRALGARALGTGVALIAVAGFAAGSAAADTLTGAGSTLITPLASAWTSQFDAANPGTTVSYEAVGSGTGIAEVGANKVDFGATDAPLTSANGTTCSPCALVPWALTATGVGYNLGTSTNGVKLTGKILAEIYLGKISNWDNAQIARVNKGVKLPNLKITPVFRRDTSGDSYTFSAFLAALSPAWKASHGGAAIAFPGSLGVGENGNSGVAGLISSVKGSIGYLSVSYLITSKIKVARVQNAKGNFEYPNLSNIANAASEIKSVPAGNALQIVNPPKAYTTAYPISTFSYALVHTSGNSDSALLKKWLTFTLTSAGSGGARFGFAPLPAVVKTAGLKTVNSLS